MPKTEVVGTRTPQELAPPQPALPARLPAAPATHLGPRGDTLFLYLQRHRQLRSVLLHDTLSQQPACSLSISRLTMAISLCQAIDKQDDTAYGLQ